MHLSGTGRNSGKVNEVKRKSKYSAGTLPCRFGREMHPEICGQPQNKQYATEAAFFVCSLDLKVRNFFRGPTEGLK